MAKWWWCCDVPSLPRPSTKRPTANGNYYDLDFVFIFTFRVRRPFAFIHSRTRTHTHTHRRTHAHFPFLLFCYVVFSILRYDNDRPRASYHRFFFLLIHTHTVASDLYKYRQNESVVVGWLSIRVKHIFNVFVCVSMLDAERNENIDEKLLFVDKIPTTFPFFLCQIFGTAHLSTHRHTVAHWHIDSVDPPYILRCIYVAYGERVRQWQYIVLYGIYSNRYNKSVKMMRVFCCCCCSCC